MKLFDANEFLTEVVKLQALLPEQAVAKIILLLSDIKGVDAVPVVRCKDCKYFWESFSGTHSCKLHKGLVGTKYDTYCSYGERKDND